jgi:GrpB-like predicted nucleotidyltransferase (UPF0157 family)/RimJ/RimL family protein N-acetyltransferase
MENRTIRLSPPDPEWRRKFDSERKLLESALGSAVLGIHAIGSTAIEGIFAKPVVDILVEAADLDRVDARNPDMAALGYLVKGENGIPRRRYFQKDVGGERAFHVHAFRRGDPQVRRHLAFRNGMNANPDLAKEYERVKMEAIRAAESRSERYQTLKGEFIEEMTRRFLREGRSLSGQELFVLETQRFTLRQMVPGDLDFLASMLGHPEVMAHYPKVLDREEAQAWLERTLTCYARAGHGFWMVERKGSGDKVGQVGLLPKEINGRAEVEVAYMVHRDFWNLGIASEAARACLEFGLEVLRSPRIVAMIRPENTASLRVSAKLGMNRIGETTHLGLFHNLYAIPG